MVARIELVIGIEDGTLLCKSSAREQEQGRPEDGATHQCTSTSSFRCLPSCSTSMSASDCVGMWQFWPRLACAALAAVIAASSTMFEISRFFAAWRTGGRRLTSRPQPSSSGFLLGRTFCSRPFPIGSSSPGTTQCCCPAGVRARSPRSSQGRGLSSLPTLRTYSSDGGSGTGLRVICRTRSKGTNSSVPSPFLYFACAHRVRAKPGTRTLKVVSLVLNCGKSRCHQQSLPFAFSAYSG